MHKTHSQHSRFYLGGLRCPTKPSGNQGTYVSAGGPSPRCREQTLLQGAVGVCWAQGQPWLPIPSYHLGSHLHLGWRTGPGLPWVPQLRQSCGCHGLTPRCTGDQEGSLAALCWIQASAEVFFHCLTPPAGEMTQRKVRAWPHQGSVVKRKKLYWKHGQEYHLGPIYFCQDCSEWGNSLKVFTDSGINFICPSMNAGNIKHIWVRVQQLTLRNGKEMLLFICNHKKPLINSLLFGAYSKSLVYLRTLEIKI